MNTLAVVHARALLGLSAPPVSVEVHLANGLPAFSIVGLPETSVRESRERVRAALLQSGIEFPNRRITVNLAPADLPKESGRFDLPIAIGIAAAAGLVPLAALQDLELVGELSLSGELRPIRAALAVAAGVKADAPGRTLILPRDNLAEARQSGLQTLHGAPDLASVIAHLRGQTLLPRPTDNASVPDEPDTEAPPDLADVRGQPLARRALEIAAAGLHPLLLCGSPGTGKSMLAQRLPGILPPLTSAEALEIAAIRSASGQPATRSRRAPFLSCHASTSPAGLLGGGQPPRPGNISLAHHGVLMMDELTEFRRTVIESLREPLETGRITLSRGPYSETFPARFLLVATMNPCPCGYYGDPTHHCVCTPGQIQRYMNKISGPLLDRIDIQCEITPVPFKDISKASPGEPSANIRERVIAARAIQTERYRDYKDIHCNAQMSERMIHEFAEPDDAGIDLLRTAMERLSLSARAYSRILKVARTIADLAASPSVQPEHLAEAISYRNLDRGDWAERGL